MEVPSKWVFNRVSIYLPTRKQRIISLAYRQIHLHQSIAPETESLYIPDVWIRDVEQFFFTMNHTFFYCHRIGCYRMEPNRMERTLDRIHFPFVTSHNLQWNTLTEAVIKQEWNETFLF